MPIKQKLLNFNSLLVSKINLIALAVCGAFTGLWMLVVSTRYYYSFSTGGWDTTLFNQILHNLLHGEFYISTKGANFLADHCHFYSFFLLPFYWLWQDSMLLRYAQIFVFFAGAYIFFLILKKKLNPWIALGAMIAYSIAPANIAMLRACFNYEPFAIPLVFLIFKALDEEKFPLYITCCVLLCLVKEQMPLVVMMFGVLCIFFKKNEKLAWGLLPFLLGLIIFLFDEFILTPFVRHDLPIIQSDQWSLYSKFGHTPGQIVFFLITHPNKILDQMLTEDNIHWFNDLFSVWGGLAFFSPQILFPAIPLFFKSILRDFKLEHNVIGVYYASTFSPYIFLGAWHTLNYIQTKQRVFLHTIAVVLMLVYGINYIPRWWPMLNTPMTTKSITMERYIKAMPAHSAVVGMIDYSKDWRDLYWVHNYLTGKYHSGKEFILPDDVEFLIMDFSDKGYEVSTSQLMLKPEFYDRWRLKDSIEDLAFYVKNTSGAPQIKLVERSPSSFIQSDNAYQVFDHKIALQEISFPEIFPKEYRIFPVTFYWESLSNEKTPFIISFKVYSADKVVYSKTRYIGGQIYPTSSWQTGEFIKENYFYLLPRLERGIYRIQLTIFNETTHKGYRSSIFQKTFTVN